MTIQFMIYTDENTFAMYKDDHTFYNSYGLPYLYDLYG